jgi:hypothetical protein
MMQQMGSGQGMFPMLQPNMWNLPMSRWPQFFGNEQIPPWFQSFDDATSGDSS